MRRSTPIQKEILKRVPQAEKTWSQMGDEIQEGIESCGKGKYLSVNEH